MTSGAALLRPRSLAWLIPRLSLKISSMLNGSKLEVVALELGMKSLMLVSVAAASSLNEQVSSFPLSNLDTKAAKPSI